MINYRELGTRALRAAAEARRLGRVGRDDPLCIFDLAERLGVEVKFIDAPSLEGMYSKDGRGTVLLPSLQHRPPGRIAFTCAHELGHHVFGHGTKVDEYLDDSPRARTSDPEEWLANTFAGYLLMPKRAIEDCLSRRSLTLENASPEDLYLIAGELGVGFHTLISHLRWSLNLLSPNVAETLSRTTPKDIRQALLPSFPCSHLVIVDQAWKGEAVAVDLRVGDVAIFPPDTVIEGNSASIALETPKSVVIQGAIPGRARAVSANGQWAVFIRVANANYVGRSIFRHLEEPDEC